MTSLNARRHSAEACLKGRSSRKNKMYIEKPKNVLAKPIRGILPFNRLWGGILHIRDDNLDIRYRGTEVKKYTILL